MGRLIRFLAAQRRPAAATLVQRSRRVMQKARRAVFPDSCVLCGHEAAGRYFCSACLRDLPRIPFACERCGQPVTIPVPPATGCADCITHPPPFRVVRAALLYDFPVDSALKALKFNGRLYYAPAFASLMMVELDRHFQHVDALVPVPLHRWRHATRGFNQAFELCRPLAEKSRLPVVRRTRRVRSTRPQTGLDAAARRQNLREAFTLDGKLHCRHPLIVDDVMTTGETCRQLACVLLQGGAQDVSVLTAAAAGRNV
jgi:ComF family protein